MKLFYICLFVESKFIFNFYFYLINTESEDVEFLRRGNKKLKIKLSSFNNIFVHI